MPFGAEILPKLWEVTRPVWAMNHLILMTTNDGAAEARKITGELLPLGVEFLFGSFSRGLS